MRDYDVTNADELSKCTCKHAVGIRDNGMSLMVTCRYCGKQTGEYLYGAINSDRIWRQVITDWNKLIKRESLFRLSFYTGT